MFSNPKPVSTARARVVRDKLTLCRSATDGGTNNRSLDDILNAIEKREIMAALHRADGQRTLAARLLDISRSRLYRRMEVLGIDPCCVGAGEIG